MTQRLRKVLAASVLAATMLLLAVPAMAGAGGSAWMYTQERTGPDCHGVRGKATYVDANWKWQGYLNKPFGFVDRSTGWFSDKNVTHSSGCGNGTGTASFIASRV